MFPASLEEGCCVAVLAPVLLAFFLGPFARQATVTAGAVPTLAVMLEDFENYSSKGFPERWRMAKNAARSIYRIEAEDGNRFLRAHAENQAIQMIFDNQILPRIIKYVWSGIVPVGTRLVHPLYSRARIVVMKSGAGEKDRWFDEKVNFYDDYKKFFDTEPGKVQGIAILSSSDATKSLSVADYDDFVLLP